MRISRVLLALCGALLIPALTLASPADSQKPKDSARAAKVAKPATHSTSGVVKSVDGSTLVIAKNAKTAATETFTLNADTARKGDLQVGARVGVRYTTDSGHNVATAVTVSGKGIKRS